MGIRVNHIPHVKSIKDHTATGGPHRVVPAIVVKFLDAMNALWNLSGLGRQPGAHGLIR